MTKAEAIAEAQKMASIMKRWNKTALANGISKASIAYLSSCFEAGVERLAAVH